jgi:hypothetical protein
LTYYKLFLHAQAFSADILSFKRRRYVDVNKLSAAAVQLFAVKLYQVSQCRFYVSVLTGNKSKIFWYVVPSHQYYTVPVGSLVHLDKQTYRHIPVCLHCFYILFFLLVLLRY